MNLLEQSNGMTEEGDFNRTSNKLSNNHHKLQECQNGAFTFLQGHVKHQRAAPVTRKVIFLTKSRCFSSTTTLFPVLLYYLFPVT